MCAYGIFPSVKIIIQICYPRPPQDHGKKKQTVKALRHKLKACRKKLMDFKTVAVNLEEKFKNNHILLSLVKSQLSRLDKPAVEYTPFERDLSLSIYYSAGKNGYRFMSSFLQLPSLRTLRKWSESLNMKTGINENILEVIKSATSGLTNRDKDCILVWDEMAIKEHLDYNPNTDELEGITDLGELGRSVYRANEGLVFMVQGINTTWKFPVSFYFSSNNTRTEHLEQLVRENIRALQHIGLNIRILICDMAFTNQSLYKSWMISPANPSIMFNGMKIYCIHDTPHLIKLVRNNLMKYDFYVTRKIHGHWKQKRVRWLHLGTFFQKDRRLTTRFAPKLTTGHLFLKDYAKMKVKLATQLFSQTVFAGMTSMIHRRILKPEAKDTAEFVKNVDEMFDILNISKIFGDKDIRCGQNIFKNMHIIDAKLQMLNALQIPKYPRKEPEFLHGLKLTLTAIKALCLDLKKEGYAHIFTRNLQQDCAENFFSKIRMRGGFCQNPTAKMFKTSFKHLFMATFIKHSSNSNVEGENKSLSEMLQELRTITTAMDTSTPLHPETEDSPMFKRITKERKLKYGAEQEKDVVSYFGPACIFKNTQKIPCIDCSSLLNKIEAGKDYIFSDSVNFSTTKTLHYLDNPTLLVFLFLNKNFDRFLSLSVGNTGTKVGSTILNHYLGCREITDWISGQCREHRLSIIKYFIRVKMFRIIKDKNEEAKKAKSWSQTRRDLRNQ